MCALCCRRRPQAHEAAGGADAPFAGSSTLSSTPSAPAIACACPSAVWLPSALDICSPPLGPPRSPPHGPSCSPPCSPPRSPPRSPHLSLPCSPHLVPPRSPPSRPASQPAPQPASQPALQPASQPASQPALQPFRAEVVRGICAKNSAFGSEIAQVFARRTIVDAAPEFSEIYLI